MLMLNMRGIAKTEISCFMRGRFRQGRKGYSKTRCHGVDKGIQLLSSKAFVAL